MDFEGELYHIVRYQKMEQGQKLDITQKQNRFGKDIFSKAFFVGEDDINFVVAKKNMLDFNENEAKILKSYTHFSCLAIRELVLELIRQKEFSNLPSRFECLFCAKTLDNAKTWLKPLLRMDNQNRPLQLVKLKCKGNVFLGDGNLMTRNTDTINSKIEMARNYWSNKNPVVLPEVLFCGQAQVVEILEEY